MPHTVNGHWEPEPEKVGNWRAMFEPERGGKQSGVPPITHGEMPHEQAPDDEAFALDLAVYKPWVLQRGSSRRVMLLDLRRFEPRSGLWMVGNWPMPISSPSIISATACCRSTSASASS